MIRSDIKQSSHIALICMARLAGSEPVEGSEGKAEGGEGWKG